jgi:predicted P-loop ATPase
MLVRISVLSALLVLTAIVAGCGGGGSSSVETNSGHPPDSAKIEKTEFIEAADAACSDYQAKRQPIKGEIEAIEGSANPESPKNVVRIGELLKEVVAAADVELESIRELEPPSGDEATIGKMLELAQEDNDLGGEVAGALEEGETSRVGKLTNEVEAVANRAKGIAEGYGLKVCGQGS